MGFDFLPAFRNLRPATLMHIADENTPFPLALVGVLAEFGCRPDLGGLRQH
jgi:hypothetical protein